MCSDLRKVAVVPTEQTLVVEQPAGHTVAVGVQLPSTNNIQDEGAMIETRSRHGTSWYSDAVLEYVGLHPIVVYALLQ